MLDWVTVTRRLLAFAIAAVLLAGCRPSPAKQFWNNRYVPFMDPQLKSYDQAMADLVAIEVQLDPDKQQTYAPGQQPPPPSLNVEQAVGQLESKVLPELANVVAATNVKPDQTWPPVVASFHNTFHDALDQKVEAYKAMCAAYHAKDKDGFTKAREQYAAATKVLADWRTTYFQYLDDGGPPDQP